MTADTRPQLEDDERDGGEPRRPEEPEREVAPEPRVAEGAATAESLAPAAAALREASSVREALERLLAVVEAIRAEPALTLLLFETMLHAGRDAQLRDALAALIRDFRAELAAALAREGADEPEPLGAALSAAWDGLFLHAVVDDRVDVAAAGEALLRLLPAAPRA